MEQVILVIHLLVAVALIATVLLQRSEGGGLGIGGSSGGGMGGLATARGTADLLTRLTAILATIFITTSLTLGIIASQKSKPDSILDAISTTEISSEVKNNLDDAKIELEAIKEVEIEAPISTE